MKKCDFLSIIHLPTCIKGNLARSPWKCFPFRAVHTGEYSSVLNNFLPVTSVVSSALRSAGETYHFEPPSPDNPGSGGCIPSRNITVANDIVSTKDLRVYYQNVRGLRTKVDCFFLSVSECNYDVIVLTETWLDERFYSTQLFGSKFNVYRTDRNVLNSSKIRGGGVLIAVSERWNSFIDPTVVSETLEQLWVKISTSSRIISIGAIYLPPDRRDNISCIENHLNSIGSIISNLAIDDFVLQFGDYNHPHLQWKASDNGFLEVDPYSVLSSSSSALVDGFSIHGLTQLNGVRNCNSRILDLVLGNDIVSHACKVTESIEPLATLDANHPALDVTINIQDLLLFEDHTDVSQIYDYRRADYAGMCEAFSRVDWLPIDDSDCIDDAVIYFKHVVRSIIVRHVPLCRPKPKPPWSNSHLHQLKRNRAKALRHYCRCRTYLMKQEFSRASNAYRAYNRFLYRRYVIRTQASLRKNPKRFWWFVNSKRKEVGLPKSVHLGEQIASSELDKCQLFAKHFKSTFNNNPATSDQIAAAARHVPYDAFDLLAFDIDEYAILMALKKMKISYAAGPDGIPSSILKNCSNLLATPLAKLFTRSLHESKFPDEWKVSLMFPVHKKGDKRNVENYRGITSLCSCSKVFEIIMKDTLFNSCKPYISTAQHGFYPNRSVATNLTEFVSLCIRTMDAGGQIDAIYTDLKAAFDRVDHGILLAKLDKLGVSHPLVRWFQSYLTNRQLYVNIGSSHSNVFTNTSGVPQGSNLGPLLFTLFINDLSYLFPPGRRLFFADDVKIFAIVNCVNDCIDLQSRLDAMVMWCSANFLTLSINKCNTISFHRKREPIIFDYRIANTVLQRVKQVRDLGVTLDQEITFKPHYNDIITRANRQLGFIFKISEDFRDPLCLRSLYCALVRSILEYSAVVWSPYHYCWVARLESVQRRFVRYALRNLPWQNRTNLPPYENRCRLLGIDTLELRRRRAQAAFAAKIIVGGIDSPELLYRFNLYAPERVMRQRNFLYIPPRNRLYGMNEPLRVIAVVFNSIDHLFDFNVPLTNSLRRML